MSKKSASPIAGYFLGLRPQESSVHGTIYRWVEYGAIDFEIIDESTVELQTPMGGAWKALSPYIQFTDRKEMMKRKYELNREIVRKNEPQNWIHWGITEG